MTSQSVIPQKKEKEPGVNAKTITPQGVFLDAYNEVWREIDAEVQDYLQATAEKILSNLKKENQSGKWEFQSVANMVVYLKGSIKKHQINTQQNHNQALKDSQDEVHANIPDYKRIPRVDLYEDVRQAKKKGTKKNLFNKEEKELITLYLEKQFTVREIAKQLNKPVMTVQDKLTATSKKVAKLPIRDLHGWIESEGIKASIRCENPESRPLTTRIGLLRKYRRTGNEVWLEKYRENSKQVLTEHECRVAYAEDKAPVFGPGRKLKVAPVSGQRPSVKDRAKLNQSMIDLYHMTITGLRLHVTTIQ